MSPFSCRSCGRQAILPVLSLGQLPLANRLLSEDDLMRPEPRYPLDVVMCTDCALVQITETVPPEILFRDYVYFSSYSTTMLDSSEALANRLVNERALDGHSLVIEIGSNDGYLLQFYQRHGVSVLGIDPALNVAEIARQERQIPTISEFFDQSLANRLATAGQRADVIHANNVLAHVSDLNGVVAGMRTLLADDGVAVVEVPYVRELVERAEFDTVYHEHLCYFSVLSLDYLFERHELTLQHVERIPIHGGSLRLFVGREGEPSDAVRDLVAAERSLGMQQHTFYAQLGERVAQVKHSVHRLLAELRADGRRIAAYGAAAKGATLLGYCGLGPTDIEFVVDLNPHKHGKFMPGAHVPIVAPEYLESAAPDYLLILAWNLSDEIVEQQAAFRARGGRFVVPVPYARIID